MKAKLLRKFRKLIDYDINAFIDYDINDFNKLGIDVRKQRKFDSSYVASVQLALNYDVEKFTGLKMSKVFMANPISVEAIRKFFKDYQKYRRRYQLPSAKLRRAIANGDCK